MSTTRLVCLSQIRETLRALHGRPNRCSVYYPLLKACIEHRDKALPQAQEIREHIIEHGVPLTGFLGDYLLLALAKCGAVEDAYDLSRQLPQLTVFSWTALISAYTDKGLPHEALRMYKSMQDQNVRPNVYTFVSLFKACGSILDIEQGMSFHAYAIKLGFTSNSYIDNALVSMYGNFGAILESDYIFHSLSVRDIVSWNAIMSAYVQDDQPEMALQLYVDMQDEGVTPDRPTTLITLQACSWMADKEEGIYSKGVCVKSKALDIGKALYVDIRRNGFGLNVYVNSSVISLYAKCGALLEAEIIFSTLPLHDLISCSAMLSAYVDKGHGGKALQLYRQMCEEGVTPDHLATAFALQACGCMLDREVHSNFELQIAKDTLLEIVKALHSDAHRKGLDSFSIITDVLVNVYCRYGAIREANNVLHNFSVQDSAPWNQLLSSYIEQGEPEMALWLYKKMLLECVIPDPQTFVSIFQACSKLSETEESTVIEGKPVKFVSSEIGRALYLDADNRGLLSSGYVANSVISMYGRCGAIAEAEDMFCRMPLRSIVSWTALISSYVEWGDAEKALKLYRQLLHEDKACLDQMMLSAVIRASVLIFFKDKVASQHSGGGQVNGICLEIGHALHAHALSKGWTSDAFVSSALISMYCKCGSISKAEHIFSALLQPTNVSWNRMLSAYVEHKHGVKALLLYQKMQEEGLIPDQVTFTIALQACTVLMGKDGDVIALEIGEALQFDVEGAGLSGDVSVVSTLLTLYCKCGALSTAEYALLRMGERTTSLPWNVIALAYLELNQEENVLELYKHMCKQHVMLDQLTLINVLQACGTAGSLSWCRKIHYDATCAGYNSDAILLGSLIRTYGSCASMMDTTASFCELTIPDIVSLNAIVCGYASEGKFVASFQMFEESKCIGFSPNEVSLLIILSGCSHSGLVCEGLRYFESIERDYGLTPDVKHYGSLLDILGRAGNFRRIDNILTELPVPSNQTIWLSLLAACRIHTNLDLAMWIFDNSMNLDSKEATTYGLMLKIHNDSEYQECMVAINDIR